MTLFNTTSRTLALAVALASPLAFATAPCGDFGECKALVEINSSDGDIGFHFLIDGKNLVSTSIFNPDQKRIFGYKARRELREQYLTETFAESAEPLCFDPLTDDDPENDDEIFVTLTDFLDRWSAGTYTFFGISDNWSFLLGETELTFNLPAAPKNIEVDFELEGQDVEGDITWEPGDDLGRCSEGMALLPTPPADVPVKLWEVVLEIDADGPLGELEYRTRIPGDVEALDVEIPSDFLESLPPNTPAKVEIGAISFDDNATFSEEGDICLNETDDGCDFDD